MKAMMKKIAFCLVGLFVVGWIVRVLLPYGQSVQSKDDLRARRDSFTLLVSRLYEFAVTNGGNFPAELKELEPVTNHDGRMIDVGNYAFRPSAHSQSETIDGTKMVVGEKPSKLPNRNLYLLSVEGRYTFTLDPEKYGSLLKANGLDEGRRPPQ